MIKYIGTAFIMTSVCMINSHHVYAQAEKDSGNSSSIKKQSANKKKHATVKNKRQKPNLAQQLLAKPESIPLLLKKGAITVDKIPNPHWKDNACTACHQKKSSAGRNNLRQRNIDKLCNTCHQELSAHDYIHVSDISIPAKIKKRMPRSFRQSLARGANKMTCITCHDLPMTCNKKRHKEKGMNPNFFRDGPYKSRASICYKCHDETKYQRVNAHDQINDKGQLQEDKCLICHTKNQDMTMANIIDDVEYNLKDNLSRLCWGCHPWKPHPGGSFSFFSGGLPNHLVRPSEEVLQRMKEMQAENNILLPLEPGTGKVFCATCHNPHERGVIKLESAAKGADTKKRLRMQDICKNCHNK